MAGKLSESELAELLACPEIGVLCTVDTRGCPEGSPIWFEASAGDPGKVFIHVGRDSRKARNIRANPQVSLTVDTREPPYRGVVLRGTVHERPLDDAILRRTAIHYLGEADGEAYLAMTASAAADTVLLEMTVTSRFTWDYAKGL